MTAQEVMRFWFEECEPRQWFQKDSAFDASLRRRFGATHTAAACGELFDWRVDHEGRLAEIIVLDQFSRNMYRDTPLAFAFDPLALVLAQEAVARGADSALPVQQRAFVYMPYMHSESPLVHTQAVRLFDQPGLEYNLKYELEHKKIIDRFGRYPHRNAILGRDSAPEEIEFLAEPGSGF